MPRARERAGHLAARRAGCSPRRPAPGTDRARHRVVDQPAGGARREHVELERQHGLGRRRRPDAVLVGEALDPLGVEVAGDHLGAGARPACAASASRPCPRPITPTRAAVEVVASRVAARSPRRTAWKTVSAVTGEGSPPPPFSIERPDHVGRVARHQVHVRGGGADVLGGDVRAAQLVHDAAAAASRRASRARCVAVVEHHRLAAAEVEAGGGGLEGHRAGQGHARRRSPHGGRPG